MKKKFSKILGVGLTLALLFSLLLTAAPVSALTQPSVTFPTTPDAEISEVDANYVISFRLVDALVPTDKIVVTFPEGTTVDTSPTATIEGWCTPVLAYRAVATIVETGVADTRVVTLTWSTDTITSLGTVKVTFTAGITNPDIAGDDYSLTVGTTKADDTVIEAAVESADYSIIEPVIGGVPGTVMWTNPAGVPMGIDSGTTPIETAIGLAEDNYTINIGPGTYVDAPVTGNDGVTFVSTGTAADTIITGAWTIGNEDIVIDDLTIEGGITVGAGGTDSTIKNCVFTTATTLLTIGGTPCTVTGNTFTVDGTDATTGIIVNAVATVSDNDFVVDTGGEAITAAADVTVSGGTITGSSGNGVCVLSGTSTITAVPFDGLDMALDVDGGTLIMSDSLVTNCGVAGATAGAGTPAIDIEAATTVSITNSEISNSLDYAIDVAALTPAVNIMFNTITGNLLNIYTAHVGTVNATHNWWGVATGPAADTIVGAAADTLVDTSAFLGAAATGDFNTGEASLLTQATVGVDVVATGTVNPAIIGVGNYVANPQDVTPDPAIAGGFYDVYLADAAVDNTTSVLIKFYNANITADTVVYVWGTIAGGWQPCETQGVNMFGNYAYVTVTDITTPAVVDLDGTPFALLAGAAAPIGTPELLAPVTGDDEVSLTPIFAWGTVTDAEGYCFELADNVNFVSPMVKLDGELGRLFVTAYAYVGELPYSTAYYWRVKAVSGAFNPWIQWVQDAHFAVESDWATGVFITMDEPEEELPPVVVEEAPPVIIEPIVEVITPAATEITPAWIYVIIGVGGVLVIALLVLIVRTRRVA